MVDVRKTAALPSRLHLTYEVLDAPGGLEGRPAAADQGIRIASLARGERLVVSTRNTSYQIVMVNPALQKVILHGGRHFPEPTDACLVGCVDEGGRRCDWIGLGRRLEVNAGNRLVVTSPIVTIERDLETASFLDVLRKKS